MKYRFRCVRSTSPERRARQRMWDAAGRTRGAWPLAAAARKFNMTWEDWRRIERCMFRAPRMAALAAAVPDGWAAGKSDYRGDGLVRVAFSASVSVERSRSDDQDVVDRVAGWIRKAQDGDPNAFDRLMEHHQALCYHVAMRKTGDRETAAESCQEAMLSAWRRIDSFSGSPAAFRSWLMRIVVNACIDRLRYESRRPSTVSLDVDPDDGPRLEPPAHSGPTVEGLAETEDVRTRLRRAVAEVPEPYRTALELHLCEFTYSEIADTLGVDVGTVSSRLSRARGHLRAGMVGTPADDSLGAHERALRPHPSHNTDERPTTGDTAAGAGS